MKDIVCKRVFLLCMGLIAMSLSAFAWDAAVKVTMKPNDAKYGKVAVSETENFNGTYSDIINANVFTHTGVGWLSPYTYNLYLFADAESGYYVEKITTTKTLKSWEIGDLGNETDNPRQLKITLSSAYKPSNPYDLGEYIAHFQQVRVSGVQSSSYSISTIDLNQSNTCDVVFNVNTNKSKDKDYDFILQQTGNAFSVVKTSYSGTQVIVTVKYTDQNHHGSSIDQATLTLKSKGDNSYASATINASSDLKPSFAIGSSLAFGTPANPIYVGDQQQSIAATSKNGTASQSAPASSGQTGAVWNASISGADASAFSVEKHPADGNCSVTFAPTEEKTYSATLTLTVQYTDAYGNTISSEAHTVALSGVAKTATGSKIEFTPSSHTFADMRVADAEATKVIRVSKQNVSNVVYSWTPEFAGIFQYDASVEGQVTISAKPAAPGTYSTTLVATGTNTLAGHTSETTTTNLPILVKIGLQKPILSSWCVSDSIYLQWNTIQFAETYTIYEINDTTKTPVTPNRRVENGKEIIAVLASSATKTYRVEAKGTYNGEEYTVWTDEVTQKVGKLTATSVPYWNLYTGTDCTSVGGFSGTKIKKTRVDLSHVFDKNGKALFDELYVFGETVSSDRTTSIKAATANAEGTAVTPCYVFKKATDDDISYYYDRTIDNVGTGSKKLPSEGTHNWTTPTTGSLKLYFTGWCPFGSNGKDKNDEGIIYIKGAAGTSVDIYLENCYLYARKHTSTGYSSGGKDGGMPTYSSIGQVSEGSGSPIVFECTSNKNSGKPFVATIHTRGTNVLLSQMGCTLSFISTCGQYSSSVYIRPAKSQSYTELNFDDKWPVDFNDAGLYERTNGYLHLQKSSTNSPSIDYGNQYGVVNFNGGRIELQNSTSASGYYNNTLAICYRSGKSSLVPLGLGMGEDGTEGIVNFNDGTIYTTPVKPGDAYKDFYEPLDVNGYSTTLRCPEKTYIKGGSHSSEIRACSSVTSSGASPTDGVSMLVKLDYKVEPDFIDENTHLAKPGFFPETIECKGCGEDGSNIELNLKEYYAENAEQYANGFYGMESLAPDDASYVHLWVPGKGRKVYDIIPWVTCMPNIEIKKSGVEIVVGGDQIVDGAEDVQVKHLLYANIDSRMSTILKEKKLGTYTYEAPVQVPGSNTYTTMKPDKVGTDRYYTISNKTEYKIYDAIYYITTATADIWTTFAAPFDITNVYVVETYPESVLSSMGIENALTEQATKNLDFASILGGNIALAQKINANGSFDKYYREFLNYAYQRDTSSKAYPLPASGKYTKYVPKDYTDNYVGRRLLKSFQKGQWDANYFLYKSRNNTWKFDGKNFTTDWEMAVPVTKTIGETERTVVMEAGKIYALMFPYCTNCEEGNERTQWDYWTGKLLIFEGFGPQKIEGTDSQEMLLQPFTNSNEGVLRGNATMAILNVPNTSTLKNAFFQENGKSAFSLDNTHEQMGKLPAGGVFMLANGSTLSAAPARAKTIHIRSGAVSYEDEANSINGVPTIAGNATLMVQQVDGGMEVIPLQPQRVDVVAANGQLVYSSILSEQTYLPLPAGIYMVRGEKEVLKVLVR